MPAERTPEHISAEAPDVAIRSVLAYVFGFLFCVILAIAGLFAYYLYIVRGPLIASRRVFPEPRLQAHPHWDLEQLQAAKRKTLSTYTWIDPARGIVQIPIYRAMQLIVARGEHALDPLQGQVSTPVPATNGANVK